MSLIRDIVPKFGTTKGPESIITETDTHTGYFFHSNTQQLILSQIRAELYHRDSTQTFITETDSIEPIHFYQYVPRIHTDTNINTDKLLKEALEWQRH